MTIRLFGQDFSPLNPKLPGNRSASPHINLAERDAAAGRPYVRATRQAEYELFTESDNRFFMRVVDAQGTFIRNKDGIVDRLLWHQVGKYQYCVRVS